MNLLFVGDVIGSPGRRALKEALPRVVDQRRVDFVVANVENAAGGFGLTMEVYRELQTLPIDVLTSGNHIWDKKEFVPACRGEVGASSRPRPGFRSGS